MNKKCFNVLILSLCFNLHSSFAASLAEDDFSGQFYISTLTGATHANNGLMETGQKHSVQLGLRKNRTTAFEIEMSAYQSDLSGSGHSSEKTNIILSYILINPEPLWNPYFLIGVGANNIPDTSSTALAKTAIGGFWALSDNKLMLRAEIGVEYSNTSQSLLDGLDSHVQIGLLFPF